MTAPDRDTHLPDSPEAGPPPAEPPQADLEWEDAVAFGIEEYDPDDPWNAVLCIEGETTAIVLPLTPKHLDHLAPHLEQIRRTQRAALGVPAEGVEETADLGSTVAGDPQQDGRHPVLSRVARAARVATGSEPVSRAWRDSKRGRYIIIAGTLIFLVLGLLLSQLLG